jgi:hypothetical protein
VNCWTCDWQRLGGSTFLGWCLWFEAAGHPKKEIPASVVDVGCKKWTVQTGKPWGPARKQDD